MCRSKIDAETMRVSSRFDTLDRQTQEIISTLLESGDRITRNKIMTQEIRDQLNALIQIVHRIDTVNEDQHRLTLEMIFEQQRVERVQNGLRSSTGDEETITAMVEMLTVSDKQETLLRRAVNEQITQSLRFPTMTSRYENVVEAYPQTFEWIFADCTAEQLPWSNFSQWLKEGDGVYWINGKAGSGKSTLMKHIFDDSRTRHFLESWAEESMKAESKPKPLFIATYFFWNSGSQEQKSQTGLIRGLLFQVLTHYPDLVAVIFPDLWAKTYSILIDGTHRDWGQGTRTLRGLMPAFRALIHQTRVPLKLCFLVDGLDEFDGNQEEMAQLFQEITKTCDVKVCLSSRPWVVFAESFKDCPSLRLQDLTRPDITRYVYGKFSENPAFSRLALQEPIAAPALLCEIIDSAAGVFLWVLIVVKSLLDGIINRDGIDILLKRLRALPQELEDLYDYLLKQISHVYMEWASKTFQMVRISRELEISPFGESLPNTNDNLVVEPLSILKFHLAINEHMSFTTVQELAHKSLAIPCQDTEVHLTARCAGLLELYSRKRLDSSIPHLASSIGYLHRTVGEYLEKDRYWSQLLRYTANTNFNPSVSLMRSCILMMSISGNDTKELQQIAYCTLTHAFHADSDATTHEVQITILDHLNEQMCSSMSPDWIFNSPLGVNEARRELAFLVLVTTFGHTGYIRQKLEKDNRLLPNSTTASILLCKLLNNGWGPRNQRAGPLPELKMVALLISFGADPNYRGQDNIHSYSAWEHLLLSAADPQFRAHRRYLQIMKLLVSDVDRWPLSDSRIQKVYAVTNHHKKSFPDECAEILGAVEQARGKGWGKKRDASLITDEDVDEANRRLNRCQRRRIEDMGTADASLVID
jgi:hypothetical protein